MSNESLEHILSQNGTINKIPIEKFFFIQTAFWIQSCLNMFWLPILQNITAIVTSSAKVMQANGTVLLLLTEGKPKTCIFYQIGVLGFFLSKDVVRRSEAKLLLPRPSYCKKTYYSAFTDTLWNIINHSDNMILVKIKA